MIYHYLKYVKFDPVEATDKISLDLKNSFLDMNADVIALMSWEFLFSLFFIRKCVHCPSHAVYESRNRL